MKLDEARIHLEHDTTMCVDHKVWFPMRVTYSCELKVEVKERFCGL